MKKASYEKNVEILWIEDDSPVAKSAISRISNGYAIIFEFSNLK